MSTEKTAGVMEPAKTQKHYRSTYINTSAYIPLLQEYCEEMAKREVLTPIKNDEVIGKYRGKTYQTPRGNWIRLNYAPGSRSGKANAFCVVDPKTKKPIKNKMGQPLTGDIFTLISNLKGVDRRTDQGWLACRLEVLDVLGEYPGRQVQTYDNKLDKKAIENDPSKQYLSKAQVAEDDKVRDDLISQMNTKMIVEIDRSGTLFGTEPVKMPLKITSHDIAYSVNGRWMDGNGEWQWGQDFPTHTELGDGELKTFKNEFTGETNKVWQCNQMKGLLYVCAMQDGSEDKRYMEVDDLLNGSRVRANGVKRWGKGSGKTKWGPNYICGKDFGFRNLPGMPAPEIETQTKSWTSKETGAQKKTILYSLKNLEKAEKNGQVVNMVWVDHKKWTHLVQKPFVNVSQIGLRPIGYDPNDHSADVAVSNIAKVVPVKDKKAMLDHVAAKALKLYGAAIKDRAAFQKDPVGEMRKIIYLGTKLEGGQQTVGGQAVGTQNDLIRNYGMRAFQRELTLDYIMRSCGYRGGIEIPQRDRPAIKAWIQGDLKQKDVEKQKDQVVGKRLIEATVAMDKNNLMLRGMSNEELQYQNKQIQEREKFVGLSMALLTDYTMSDGTKLQKGTGAAEWSKPIAKQDAYDILSDMCYQDKLMYNNPAKKEQADRREIHFDLTVGGETFKDVSLTLGNLETGNEPFVADSLMNLLLKKERENAYSREVINKNFKELDDVRKNKFVKEEFAAVSKEDMVGKAKDEYDAATDSLAATLISFKEDEACYKKALELEGKTLDHDNFKLEADVYRYQVPTKDKTLLYEAYGTQNIVGIREQPQKTGAETYNECMVVELRKPLEPLKDEQNNNIHSTVAVSRDPVPVFGDTSTRRDRPTRTIEATPYKKEEEWKEHNMMGMCFSVEYQAAPDEKAQVFRGEKARDKLMLISTVDKLSFDQEKAGFRSVENLDPVKVTVKWNNTVVFEKSDRIGSKAFSNCHSIEELMSSQRDSLDENSKKALNVMMKADHEQMKYSQNHDLNTAMQKNEILEQKEIDKILRQNKQVLEYQDETNKEGISRVDQLETEAVVNFKESDQDVMDHIVDRIMSEDKVRDSAGLKAVTEEIRAARPEMEKHLKKSLERASVQKKVNGRPSGVKHKGPTDDLQR